MFETIFPGLSSAQNLHPMVIHFPIAFWVAASGFWGFAAITKNDEVWKFGIWMQTLATLSALVAVGFGFWATEKMGHDSPGHGLVHLHRDFMVTVTIASSLLTAVAWWKRRANSWRYVLAGLAAIVVLSATLGADRGAELVFRYGVGVARESPPDDSHSHDEGEGHEHGSESSSHHEDPENGRDHHAGDPRESGADQNSDDHHEDSAKKDGKIDEKQKAEKKPEPDGHAHEPGHEH